AHLSPPHIPSFPTRRSSDLTEFRTTLPPNAVMDFRLLEHILDKAKDKAVVKVENNTNLVLQVLLPLIPWLLIFGFIWFFVFRQLDRKSTRLNSSHQIISYAV